MTLSQEASNCLREAGVEENIALNIIINLMKGTISNIEKSMSPREALTGPIMRGDLSTIKTHLSSFSDCKQRFLYSTLGKATIALTSHDLVTKAQLEKDLSLQNT